MTRTHFSIAARSLFALATVAVAACSDVSAPVPADNAPPPAVASQSITALPGGSAFSTASTDSVSLSRLSGDTLIISGTTSGGGTYTTFSSIKCYEKTASHNRTNILGQVVIGVKVTLNWCANRGVITGYSVVRSYRTQYLWRFENWQDTQLSKASSSTWTYKTTGYFRACASFCYQTGYAGLKISFHGDGSVSVTKTTSI
jgi:hypothetical protein